MKRRGPEMCTFGVLGLSCASPGGPVWWGRRAFTMAQVVLLSRTTSCFLSFLIPVKTLRDAAQGMVSFRDAVGLVHSGARSAPTNQKFGPSSSGVGGGNVLSGPTSQQLGTRPRSQRFHDVGIVEAASPVHQPRQKFTQPQSTVCVSRQPSKLLGLVPKRRKDWKMHLSEPNEGRIWLQVGERLDSTAQFVEGCQKRLQSAEAVVKEAIVFPTQGSGRVGGRATEFGDSQSGGCSTGAGTPNSANCRQRRIGSGQFTESTYLTVGAGTGGSPSEESKVFVRSISGFERVVAKCIVARVGSSPRQISGSRCTREIERT